MENFLKEIIKEAGYLAKGYFHEGVTHSTKSCPADLVTEADKEVSRFLIDKIAKKFPAHGIISEEEPDEINPGAEYTWVIDPIDGTRNFANHIAYWCTMIGIDKAGAPYLGAVYDAMNDELFFAKVGYGSYLNEKKICVSDGENLESCFLVFNTGLKNNPVYKSEKFDDYVKAYNKIIKEQAGGLKLYNYGSMLSVCQLAAGRINGALQNAGLYHDYLAPYVIVTEAGGKWTDSRGQAWKKGGRDIVVAGPKMHAKLLKFFE